MPWDVQMYKDITCVPTEKHLQMDTTVAAIQQLMSAYLKKEEEQVGERTQRFTEQQQAALLDLETRVRQDRNTVLM